MFNTAETVIDTIQTAKKQAVKTFVKHEAIAESLSKWIDTETTIAKDAVKVGTDTATTIGKEVVKAAQEAAKADHFKEATEQFTSFWKDAFKPATVKAK
jgi:hypothetical protein